jgi:hypothetical protein
MTRRCRLVVLQTCSLAFHVAVLVTIVDTCYRKQIRSGHGGWNLGSHGASFNHPCAHSGLALLEVYLEVLISSDFLSLLTLILTFVAY